MKISFILNSYLLLWIVCTIYVAQGFVKGKTFCFRYLDFYFQHGEYSTLQLQPANSFLQPAKKSQDLNKVSLLLQKLDFAKEINEHICNFVSTQ